MVQKWSKTINKRSHMVKDSKKNIKKALKIVKKGQKWSKWQKK